MKKKMKAGVVPVVGLLLSVLIGIWIVADSGYTLYKGTADIVDKVMNLIFLVIGVVILIGSIVTWFFQRNRSKD
ncbi:hypothetical protein [Lentilactobacillus buchneri]|uniref:Uncharacterized protein n=1 Tax=Lentilactobacillus buchneri DSM 20057 TaxID=1423728 RepID=A0A4R5NK28_LENBU|nr:MULTISPECIES: hypothetical protein [Lentilactobacillus]MCC6100828.1 hypothetical protein [Lactobacillus sp.]WCJ52671.1 hypothetical protein OKF32_05055 [Lentilactobacillus sp. Egmn17]AEB72471.1 hypothetical protein Lbuc_0189 [Lentilactobacillus buchneri NRRL B-30929]KRK68274.1 hypothetical protein FC79_GL000718 [Lentilactobacillus buchneri DSM 20057]MCT2883208.1 hypothetical protein [Lentilactobacillus buchneri]